MTAGRKVIVFNRKASHEYFLEDRFEAGLVLQGTEIKAIRKGHAQIKDAYISFTNNEAFIKEMHIPEYEFGNRFNHDETRIRKLLLHKSEIIKLQQKVKLKGYTVIPAFQAFCRTEMQLFAARRMPGSGSRRKWCGIRSGRICPAARCRPGA